jgi:predicted CXXCH cytochrome family protein
MRGAHERHAGGPRCVRTRGRTPWRAAPLLALALLAAPLLGARPALHPPRNPDLIRRLTAQGPHAGDCDQCHSQHGEGQLGSVYPNALNGPDDNSLCLRCHDTPWQGGSLGTGTLYLGSAHGSSLANVWPGPDPPLRTEPDAPTKCLNCHDPHGWTDAQGLIPELTVAREEKLCLTCHDGSPAEDVQSDFVKPFRHPVATWSGRHTGPTESAPEEFGVTPPGHRHAECDDCHNSHLARADAAPPAGVDASKTTLGVSRVTVLNGAAGAPPAYTFVPGADTLAGATAEYELCFKCHSSWTTQPTGQTDQARMLNPANPSYHPVEAAGRNSGIDVAAFAAGWTALSVTRCGDCHGSDFGTARGPHGSSYEHLLRSPYAAAPTAHLSTSDELCFRCHAYDVYANPGAPEGTRAASRFNAPLTPHGHAEHVGTDQVPCYACHVTHGSTSQPFLIATGRGPGIVSYSATAGGGTCAPTCHASQSYTVNYAR